jgi:hypothetical protein
VASRKSLNAWPATVAGAAAARENRHLLGRLDIALRFGDDDSLRVGGERFGASAALGEGFAEQLPGRRIAGVALDRCPQMTGGDGGVAGLQILVAE